MKEHEIALNYLLEVLLLNPGEAVTYLLLGRIYIQRGQMELASAALKRAQGLVPYFNAARQLMKVVDENTYHE
jgi:cytochrome c-type biogenesis protein CcmH/NrfG